MKNEYTFRIDVFTPDTLSMARLASYMAGLAGLLGYEDRTHFVRLDFGSACVVARVEDQNVPKVRKRLEVVEGPDAAPDVIKAFKLLDSLLAEDNAVGEVISPEGAVIVPFPGRTRPKPLTFPAFRQDGSLDGQIVSIWRQGQDRSCDTPRRRDNLFQY